MIGQRNLVNGQYVASSSSIPIRERNGSKKSGHVKLLQSVPRLLLFCSAQQTTTAHSADRMSIKGQGRIGQNRPWDFESGRAFHARRGNEIKQFRFRTCSLFRFINCNVFEHRRLGPTLLIDAVHDQVEHGCRVNISSSAWRWRRQQLC